jgi:hypothetical protein
MMLSVRTIPNNAELMTKIQTYEKELKAHKSSLTSSKQQAAQHDREELIGGGFTTFTVSKSHTFIFQSNLFF